MMKSRRAAKKWQGLAVFGVIALALSLGRPALAAQDPWPKRFEHPQGEVVMYQPQLESFKGDQLTARAAVSAKTKDLKQPVFGAIWLSAKVAVDRDTRMATIEQAKVTDAKFPSAVNAKPEQLNKIKTFLNTEMSGHNIPISLDRLLAALDAVEKERVRDQGLKNDPPRIIFATHPTVLVPLDGDPKLLPVPQSTLMRVANTPFLMLYEPRAKAYYLRGGDKWLSAGDLPGPWLDVKTVPDSLKNLEAQFKKAEQAQGVSPAKKVEAEGDKMPAIIVSTVSAELLVTRGDPQYTPIAGTNLLFVSNTDNNIFMDTGTQEYYALLSGRWFKTKSLGNGPWTYVAPDKLPGDFAKIPENSVKGFVLVNVAGTTMAKEAVLDNSIPQTGVIDRKKATTKVEYAGSPKFEKIAGTDLEYAVNTGKSVFKEGTKYYAVDQGIWYEADSPGGPWKVSIKPPQQVDQIPPSNPNYNAKYVKVYDSTEDTVTVGYTPGYTGSYVDNGTVVYGTGYSYPGYAAPDVYIPAPVTYGYAAAYNPYAASWGYQPAYYSPANWLVPGLVGFAAGVAVGAAVDHWWGHGPYYGGGGWWGPGGYNNININNIHNNVINPRPDHRPGPPRPNGRPIIHPVVHPENRPNLYNRPGNQNNLAAKGAKPDTKPGTPVKPGTPATHPGQAAKPGTPTAKPTQVATAKPVQTQVKPAAGKNNVMADKNGNVYKRDNQGNWQERQGNQWSKPATPSRPPTTPPPSTSRPTTTKPGTPTTTARPPTTTAPRPSPDYSQLNRDYAARQRGETRTQNYQRAYSPPSGGVSHPSGGARSPGGGRRR